MIEDEVLFTPQLATLVVDLHKSISKLLDDNYDISLTEFCFLASLCTHSGTMLISDFPATLGSSSNTIIAAVNRLHEKRLVTKTKSEEDKRVTIYHETEEGKKIVEEGMDKTFMHLKDTVWRKHSDEDIQKVLRTSAPVAKNLGIDLCECDKTLHPIMMPAYHMTIAALVYRWTNEIKSYASLSFTEYRCLALLESRPSSLSCSKIAETLMLDKSSVSSLIASLKQKALVAVEQGEDRRSSEISLTEKGQITVALLSAKLSRITASIYRDVDPEIKTETNELHMRMYATYASPADR